MANNKALAAYYRGKAARSKSKVKSHYGQVAKKTQPKQVKTKKKKEQPKPSTPKVGSASKPTTSKSKPSQSKPATKKTTTPTRAGSRSGSFTPVNSKQTERQAGAEKASKKLTTSVDVRTVGKKDKNGNTIINDYTKKQGGTAKGDAARAYNKAKTAKQNRYEDGKKKVLTVSKEQLKKEQDAAARQARFETNSLVASGQVSKEDANKYVKQAKKDVKKSHTLEYSKAIMDNEDFQRVGNASKFANTKVEDKKAADKAKREARYYANQAVASGEMTQEEADKYVKKAGKGHYTSQGNNILEKLGGEGTAEKVGTQTAGWLNDSKFAAGVMQGASYSDITRGVGKYNKQAAELVDKTKQSGAFNAGYMVGQGAQFMLGGTGKMTDALVKGVTKKGLERSALNVGIRKGASDMMFEAPLNTLDALKMSTDANGNFDKNSFVKYMALNSGLSGGIGGLIGGVGSKLAKKDAKEFIALSAKINSGAGITEQEMERFGKLQQKFESIRQGGDVAKTDVVNKADYDAEVGKKVFENGGTVDDAIKVVNGGGTHTEKIGYANSIKETANSQFEQLRVAREQMLEQAKSASPEEAKVLRSEASKLSQEINRLGEIANVAERQLAIELKRNKKAITELTQNVKNMSEATGVNYRVVTDKDMRKIIADNGGDVSDDYFYKGFYYKNKDGETEILINADSPQAHQTVIGHETGHLIKSANEKEFDDLGNMLEDYAKKQGDFDAVYEQLKRSYPEATEAELREEVTCELLGKYVYGADDKFIKQLAGEKPSVVQQILDYFKKLLKGTSDKEMAKELKAIIDKTENLVKGIDNADAEKPKFSIVKKVTAEDGSEYENVVKLDNTTFEGKTKKERVQALKDRIENDFMGHEITAYDEAGNPITLHFAESSNKHRKNGGAKKRTIEELSRKPSFRSKTKQHQDLAAQIDEVVEVAKGWDIKDENSHGWLDKNGWVERKFYALDRNDNILECKLSIAKAEDGRDIVYDVGIENEVGVRDTAVKTDVPPTSKEKITQPSQDVNTFPKDNITAKTITDSSGKVTKEADDAYMKAAKSGDIETAQKFADTLAKEKGYVVNAHRGGIQTAYDKEHGYYIGTMFSSDKNIASAFAYGNKENLGSYYLKMDKPLVIDAEGHSYVDVPVRDTHPDKELIEYAQNDIDYIGGERDYGSISVDDIGKWADEHGYDSVEIRNVKEGVGGDPATDYIVINPEQIKSADAITKDDNGKIIPLSERFDSEKNDIRFSKEKKPKKTLYNFTNEKPEQKISKKVEKLQQENDAQIKTMTTSNDADEVVEALAKSDEIEAKIEGLGSTPRRGETPKTEVKGTAKADEPEKTEAQKMSESKYVSDEVKTALKDIEEAGVYKEQAEKTAKKYNDLNGKIGGLVNRIERAKKSDKYATEAERAEHVADLEDQLRTLRNKQKNVAGEIEQMGRMKAVDDTKPAGEQIKELRGGETKVNKQRIKTDNLTKTDNWIKDKWNSVRRLWEDSLIDVENTAKSSGDMKLRNEILTAANRVRNSMSMANDWITRKRRTFDNKVGGKGLDEIFSKELIENEPKYADFQEYLIMKHVPARHAKGTDIYPEVSPELAEKRVKELEAQYNTKVKVGDKEMTEIEAWANDVYDYLKDLQQYRVDSGMLSQEAADQFAKDYPFYVPTNRVNDDEAIDFFTGGLSNQIRTAKGGENDVLDMYSQLYTATNKTIHAAEENQMLNLYFKAKGVTDAQIKEYSLDDLEHAVIEANVNKKTGKATVSFFVDGKPVKLPCNHQLALGLREMDGLEFERLMKAAKVATLYGKPFKALITDWNVVFGVRNGARDLQQALVNSKSTRYFANSMGSAAHSIVDKNSPMRKLYASMGGEQAQLVSYDAVAKQMGIEKQSKVDAFHEKAQELIDLEFKGKHVNPIHWAEAFNGSIEMMPRLSEFIGTIKKEANKVLDPNYKGIGTSPVKKLRDEIERECKKLVSDGKLEEKELSAEVENRFQQKLIDLVDKDTIDTAMRNANDITLNFGRSGVLGKALNMGFVPYLNPSIQGLSKLIRLFTEGGQEGGWKALASIGMKLGTFTIVPAVFNEFTLKDNEDYQNLNTRDKDNNFFISLGFFDDDLDGKFLKFPKPRENAVLAEPIEYGLRYWFDETEYGFFDMGKLKTEGNLWEKIPLTDEGKQAFRTAIDNIGVINPLTSNMVSPLWQTFHNETWYGGKIESAYETSIDEKTGKPVVPVNERHDVSTSGVAIWLGQTKGAKFLNLSPKKIDNILDSYTGMIYDLGISQTTEEAKTRGNWFERTMASQFVKDSVFSNKLSTKAWDKMDGMTPEEQKKYKSSYMYDTFKYDDAMDLITSDKTMTAKEKMEAKRELQIQKNKLNREAIDGKQNTSNPLVDISKHLGATKTLNHFLPDFGDSKYGTWKDYFKTYKDAKGYKGLTKAQKEKESQKFLDVYSLGVKGMLWVDQTDSHDSPSWAMTGVAAAQLNARNKLKEKDAKTIMTACGVYDSQTASYFKYAAHDGTVYRYAVTQRNLDKTFDKLDKWGMDTKSGLWKGTFDKSMGAKGGTLAMSLATSKKVDFKDRAYYIANSSDPQMLVKMNAARGFAEKYGHKTKEICILAQQADALGDGNTYLKNDEIINVCNQMKGSMEEKSMAYVLLGGKPKKNPFGAIGNYSHEGDTGITADEEESSGGGRRRRGRRGWGHGGGGGGSKGEMPNTASGAFKGKVTNPFGTSNGSKASNLNDAYRKKAKKLRNQLS